MVREGVVHVEAVEEAQGERKRRNDQLKARLVVVGVDPLPTTINQEIKTLRGMAAVVAMVNHSHILVYSLSPSDTL